MSDFWDRHVAELHSRWKMHDLDSDFDQFHKMRHIPPGKNFVWRTKQAFSWLQRNTPHKKIRHPSLQPWPKIQAFFKKMWQFPNHVSPCQPPPYCGSHKGSVGHIELWWRGGHTVNFTNTGTHCKALSCDGDVNLTERGHLKMSWAAATDGTVRTWSHWKWENGKMGKLSLEHFPAWGNLIGEWEMWTSVIWTKGGNKCKNAKYSDSFDLYIYCVNWFRIGHNGPSPHCGQGDECKIVRIINVPTSLTCTTCVLTGMFKCMLTYVFLNSPGQGILLCWHELSTNWSLKKV